MIKSNNRKWHLCFTKNLSGKKNAGTHGFDIKMMVKILPFFQILFSPISLQEAVLIKPQDSFSIIMS